MVVMQNVVLLNFFCLKPNRSKFNTDVERVFELKLYIVYYEGTGSAWIDCNSGVPLPICVNLCFKTVVKLPSSDSRLSSQ